MGIILFLSLLMTDISLADRGTDLDEFDDLELESLDRQKKKSTKGNDGGQRLILFDDNLYLLDDDFDFGEDELKLQTLELDPDDMETAKEYENFLNAFFENSTSLGTSSSSKPNHPRQKQTRISRNDDDYNSKPSRKSARKARPDKSAPPTATFRPSRGALGFGISTIIGATIPITMNGFSTGSNMGIRIDTPISFNLAGMEANIGTDIYLSNMTASEGSDNLKLTNIIGNVSIFPFSSIEFRTGLALSPGAIGGQDMPLSTIGLPVDINYYLPFNFSGFKFALNLHAQRTLGYPPVAGSLDGDATDFLYFGLLINTPLKF